MNSLVSLIVSYAVNALWQAPLIAAAAWMAALLLRRVGPRAQHVVWVAALLTMVSLPAVPRYHWARNTPNANVSIGYDDVDLSSLAPLAPASHPIWDAQSGIATLPRLLVIVLLCGYLAAALYFGLRLGWWLWRTRMLVRDAEPVEFSEAAHSVWTRCRDAFLLEHVDTLESPEMLSPVAVGMRQPALLLPDGFAQHADSEELMTALAHECAHLQRKDFVKNVAYELISLPIAFHPVLWLVKRQIAETREMICDGMAVERVMEAPRYVRSLLRLAEGVVRPPVRSVAMGMFDGRTLERRILSMHMRKKQMHPALRLGLMLPGALLLAVAVLSGASLAVGVEARAVPMRIPAATAVHDAQQAAQPQIDKSMTPEERAKLEEQIRTLSEELKTLNEQSHQQTEAARIAAARDREAMQQKLALLLKSDMAEQKQSQWLTDRKQKADELFLQLQKDLAERSKKVTQDQAELSELRGQAFEDAFARPKGNDAAALISGAQAGQAQSAAARSSTTKDETPIQIRGDVIAGTKISGAEPEYPPIAKAAHVSGSVVLHAIVNKMGAVQNLAIVSGPQMLQNAALQAVKTWRYRPYLLNGHPSAVETTITVNFMIQGEVMSPPPAAAVPVPTVGPARIAGGVLAGARISGDSPAYPPIAQAAHVGGAVVLHAIIGKSGTVENLEVLSGPQMLQNAALEAVKTWKYKPYLLNGDPTEVDTTITVNFTPEPTSPAAPDAKTSLLQRENFLLPRNAHAGGDVSAPIVIRSVEPEYTQAARKTKSSGVVVVGLLVDREGHPQHVRVVRPTESADLNAAAVRAVQQYLFKPAVRKGEPVQVSLSIEVDFQLF